MIDDDKDRIVAETSLHCAELGTVQISDFQSFIVWHMCKLTTMFCYTKIWYKQVLLFSVMSPQEKLGPLHDPESGEKGD